jgi:hypothetical protein
MTEYTKLQPKDGDVVFGCGHAKSGGKSFHWFKFPEPMKVQRPDGSFVEGEWICQCAMCFANQIGEMPEIKQDFIWLGDEPAIKKPVQS